MFPKHIYQGKNASCSASRLAEMVAKCRAVCRAKSVPLWWREGIIGYAAADKNATSSPTIMRHTKCSSVKKAVFENFLLLNCDVTMRWHKTAALRWHKTPNSKFAPVTLFEGDLQPDIGCGEPTAFTRTGNSKLLTPTLKYRSCFWDSKSLESMATEEHQIGLKEKSDRLLSFAALYTAKTWRNLRFTPWRCVPNRILYWKVQILFFCVGDSKTYDIDSRAPYCTIGSFGEPRVLMRPCTSSICTSWFAEANESTKYH